MKYVEDDSTVFWAIGPDSGVIAKHALFCGKEVEIVVPFEGVHSGEVTHKILPGIIRFMPGFCIPFSLYVFIYLFINLFLLNASCS